MVNNTGLEPSLFLEGQPETAHREHRKYNPNTRHHHAHLRHAHQRLKPRQAGVATAVEQVNSIVTVLQTLSYVQQVNVDSTGSVLSTQYRLTNTPLGFTAPTSTPASPTTSDVSESPAASAALSAQPDSSSAQSLPPVSSTSQSLSSVPSIPVTTGFPSLSTISNSTTSSSKLSSSSLSSTCSNSSTISLCSSSSSSSLTYLTLGSSSSSFASSTSSSASPSASFTSSFSSSSTSAFSSASAQVTSTNAGGNGGTVGGATGAAPSYASPSSTEAAGSSSSGSSTPPTSVVVGSVVGSVAGFAFLVLLILALVKWRKRKNMLSLGNGNDGGAESAARDLPPTTPAEGMTHRRSMPFIVPAALATLTGFGKRSSQRIERTAPSERGFYRVSGRKLPSVLQTGGDGYGGSVPETNPMSGSFYRDSTGFYGGGGASQSPSSPLASPVGISTDRDSGVPVMRPSPARTPVTEHGPFGAPPPSTPPPPLAPPRRLDSPDGLGRSHPSQDGSHASRFTEQV